MYVLQQGCTTSTSWGPRFLNQPTLLMQQTEDGRQENRPFELLGSLVGAPVLIGWGHVPVYIVLLIHKLISSSCSVADHHPKSTFHRHRWCKSLLPVDSSFQLTALPFRIQDTYLVCLSCGPYYYSLLVTGRCCSRWQQGSEGGVIV